MWQEKYWKCFVKTEVDIGVGVGFSLEWSDECDDFCVDVVGGIGGWG